MVTATTEFRDACSLEESYNKSKQSIKKQRLTLSTEVHIVKVTVFPVLMHRCEKERKVEHRRIHSFELWCWRRLLRVLGLQGDQNQSILKEISPNYSLEGLMLKLRHQYFGHLIERADSLERTLML